MEPDDVFVTLKSGRRIVTFRDEDAQCPRDGDWYMMTGALTVLDYDHRLHVPAVYPWDQLHSAWAHLGQYMRRDSDRNMGSSPHDPDTVIRWARIFYERTLVFDGRTFWWTEPAQMAANWPRLVQGSHEYVENEREVIKQEQETYRRWVDGEVYGVGIRELARYVRDLGQGVDVKDFVESWVEPDDELTLWGCYLDDNYNAATVALQSFTLTLEETAELETLR